MAADPVPTIVEEKGETSLSFSDSSDATPKEKHAYFPLDYEPKEIQVIVREAILLAGGAAAILLQVANPGVGQGVNEHSNFAYRPLDRLRTTMTYVYTIACGSASEKAAVIDMVHRAHSTVRGRGYSADDPDLQLWVAATVRHRHKARIPCFTDSFFC
jgi:hypothetical protein